MTLILGYKLDFFDDKYLTQALSHRSFSKNNNERLEFLGDSVLNFVIADWLYTNFPSESEGKLSRMRAQLVRGETLAEIASSYHLGDHIILGVGELKSGGHKRKSVLEDCVEALFGAVFLDKGFEECKKFILKVMDERLQKVDPNISDKDSKTQLQEFLQGQKLPLPSYRLANEFGKDHLKEFEIEGQIEGLDVSVRARARSIKKAEQACAKLILEQLKP